MTIQEKEKIFVLFGLANRDSVGKLCAVLKEGATIVVQRSARSHATTQEFSLTFDRGRFVTHDGQTSLTSAELYERYGDRNIDIPKSGLVPERSDFLGTKVAWEIGVRHPMAQTMWETSDRGGDVWGS